MLETCRHLIDLLRRRDVNGGATQEFSSVASVEARTAEATATVLMSQRPSQRPRSLSLVSVRLELAQVVTFLHRAVLESPFEDTVACAMAGLIHVFSLCFDSAPSCRGLRRYLSFGYLSVFRFSVLYVAKGRDYAAC